MKISFLIFIICSVLSLNSIAASSDSTSRSRVYRKGIMHLQEGALDSATAAFNQLLGNQSTTAAGYYGLALVILQQDPSAKEVEDYLHNALRLDPHFTAAWIKLAEVVGRRSFPPSDEVVNILMSACRFNPDNKSIYHRYITEVIWNSEEESAAGFLDSLMHVYPRDGNYIFDLATMTYNLENYKKSLTLLDTLENLDIKRLNCQLSLLRAKNYFELDQPVKGMDYYWTALKSIQDQCDADAVFSDLYYIMKDDEYKCLHSLAIGEITKFYERFWRSRNPDRAGVYNARIPEHYRRLFYARRNYRRYIHQHQEFKNELLYEFEHPFRGLGVQMGDTLVNPLVYKPLLTDRDLDDMGLIFVRHGKPDNWVTYMCPVCTLNISWHYYKNYTRSELIFHFIKHSGVRGWTLESLPTYFENRWELGNPYIFLDPTHKENFNPSDILLYYQRIDDENTTYIKNGVRSETSDYTYDAESLTVPMQFVSFKGKGGATQMDLYYGLQGKEFELSAENGKKYLTYAKFVGIYDTLWNEVFRLQKNDKYSIALNEEEWNASVVMRMEQFNLAPGLYHYEFQIRDSDSDKLAVIKNTCRVPDYNLDSLALSDILISSPINVSQNPSVFMKANLAIHPHMFSPFNERAVIGLYFEIYNLLYDPEDRTHFLIHWTLSEIEDPEKSSWLQSVIGFIGNLFSDKSASLKSTLEFEGNSRDDHVYFNLDLRDAQPGRYQLIIAAEDLNTGSQTDGKNIEFVIN